jgi:hypothetical protein
MNTKSLGPNNEILRFKIFNAETEFGSESGFANLPANTISIVPALARQDSANWRTDIKCSTLFHELLHLVGLFDEYEETEYRYVIEDPKTTMGNKIKEANSRYYSQPAFNCRPKFEEDSIMSDAKLAYNKVFYNYFISRSWCIGSKNKVHTFLKANSNLGAGKTVYLNQCPKGFQASNYEDEIPISDKLVNDFINNNFLEFPETNVLPKELIKLAIPVYKLEKHSPENTIIKERHFNAIVYPGCLEKNHDYYFAGQNSYSTTSDRGGSGCKAFPKFN